jgi:hypothetical protein
MIGGGDFTQFCFVCSQSGKMLVFFFHFHNGRIEYNVNELSHTQRANQMLPVDFNHSMGKLSQNVNKVYENAKTKKKGFQEVLFFLQNTNNN